jgi:hypothetical protein
MIRRSLPAALVLATASLAHAQVVPPVPSPFPPSAASAAARAAAAPAPAAAQRQAWLAMFARAYFPGRSGQIMVVPREGDVLTREGADVVFMHGTPWGYDTRIPMIFWGSRYVKPGRYVEAAAQPDIVPTVARVLGLPVSGITGHALSAARPAAPAPKAVLVLVLDAFRADYLDRHAALLPNLSRLRREGASFERARVSHLPTITTVGHATIATGTDGRYHGIVANNWFNPAAGKVETPFPGLMPDNVMALTIADRWSWETDGRAVIVAQASTGNASALAGHGACLAQGRPVIYAVYSGVSGRWETQARCYRLPEYLKAFDARTLWEGTDGTWMGHSAATPEDIKRTARFSRFEGDALVAMIDNEPIGADDVTDLVLANFKVADYLGHAYGPDSAELRAGLAEIDGQVGRVVEALARKAGPGGALVVITADHGMAAEPPPGRLRVYNGEVVKRVHERFDREGKLITHFGAENGQLYVDRARARTLGVTIGQIRDLLQKEPYIVAAFTEDEVRRVRLP